MHGECDGFTKKKKKYKWVFFNNKGGGTAWKLLEMREDISGSEPGEATITHLAFVLFFPFMLFRIYIHFLILFFVGKAA